MRRMIDVTALCSETSHNYTRSDYAPSYPHKPERAYFPHLFSLPLCLLRAFATKRLIDMVEGSLAERLCVLDSNLHGHSVA